MRSVVLMQAVLSGLPEAQQTQIQTECWRAEPIARPEAAVQVLGQAARARPEQVVIEQTVAQVFNMDGSELHRVTRGRAPVARAAGGDVSCARRLRPDADGSRADVLAR